MMFLFGFAGREKGSTSLTLFEGMHTMQSSKTGSKMRCEDIAFTQRSLHVALIPKEKEGRLIDLLGGSTPTNELF
jgi:hypothetical protein